MSQPVPDVAAVRAMLSVSPHTARWLVDQTRRAVDAATAGRYGAQIAVLECLVSTLLGLDCQAGARATP